MFKNDLAITDIKIKQSSNMELVTEKNLQICWSVYPSVHWTVCLLVRLSHFFGFCGLWSHCGCPNDQVTSNTALAHPHATGVAVYPALLT